MAPKSPLPNARPFRPLYTRPLAWSLLPLPYRGTDTIRHFGFGSLVSILLAMVSVPGTVVADEVSLHDGEIEEPLLPEKERPEIDADTPELGAILICENWDDTNVPFEVIDVANGDNYNVWVLKEVAGSDMRVGWNNQLPQTFSGLSLVAEEDNDLISGPVFWFYNTDEVDITGVCGDFLKYSYAQPGSPSDVRITVNFSGGTETITDTEEEVESTSWGISATNIWTIVVDLVESSRTFEVEFGFSHTEQLTKTASISVTTVKKGFGQSYEITNP